MFQTRFFRDIYIYIHVHIHIHIHVHVRVRVCLFFCVVRCHVVCRASLGGWVVGWLGVVWCCRHVVVVVVFVLVSWSLSLRRHRKIERRRENKKEMARRSLNKKSEECSFLLRMMSTLQRPRAERSMIEQKNGLDPTFSLRIGAQHLYQVKRMVRGIGNVPCSTYSQTQNG